MLTDRIAPVRPGLEDALTPFSPCVSSAAHPGRQAGNPARIPRVVPIRSDGETPRGSETSHREDSSSSARSGSTGGSGSNSGGESDGDGSGASWGKASMAGVLGFEFVGLLGAGLFVGYYVDEKLQTSPVGILVGLALGLAAAALHMWRVARRLMSEHSDSEA